MDIIRCASKSAAFYVLFRISKSGSSSKCWLTCISNSLWLTEFANTSEHMGHTRSLGVGESDGFGTAKQSRTWCWKSSMGIVILKHVPRLQETLFAFFSVYFSAFRWENVRAQKKKDLFIFFSVHLCLQMRKREERVESSVFGRTAPLF